MIMPLRARARVHGIFARHTVNDIMRITDKGRATVYNWLAGEKPTLPTYLELMLYWMSSEEQLRGYSDCLILER